VSINWSARVSWQEVCARAAARRKYNSLRKFRAAERRQQVLELALELGGLHRGVQSRIAEVLQVHRSVISKDIKQLMPLVTVCPTCGAMRPREDW